MKIQMEGKLNCEMEGKLNCEMETKRNSKMKDKNKWNGKRRLDESLKYRG